MARLGVGVAQTALYAFCLNGGDALHAREKTLLRLFARPRVRHGVVLCVPREWMAAASCWIWRRRLLLFVVCCLCRFFVRVFFCRDLLHKVVHSAAIKKKM